MPVIDPRLNVLLAELSSRSKSVTAEPPASELESAPRAPEKIRAIIKFSGSIDAFTALGCDTFSVLGQLATIAIPVEQIHAVLALPGLVKIELSRPLFRELDESIPAIRANEVRNNGLPFGGAGKFTGSGVIVGIIDAGFKFDHHVFCDPADPKKTRILFFWDQDLTPSGTESSPTLSGGSTYGVEYDKAKIETALNNANPYSIVRTDPDSHGTHVAGIAAGNGSQSGGVANVSCDCHGAFHYVGVAPEADLMFVKLDSSDHTELGESQHLVDAVTYIQQKAKALGKAAVINISLGDNLGAHDGTSLVEQWIDVTLLLFASSGFAVVKAAGNQGNKKLHAQTNVPINTAPSNGKVELKFEVTPHTTGKTIEIDIWYPDAHSLNCKITPPGNNLSNDTTTSPGSVVTATEQTKSSQIAIDSQLKDPDNDFKRIFITITPPVGDHTLTGSWTIELSNSSVSTPVPVNAWIQRDQPAKFTTFVTIPLTVSVPGTAQHIITVGNFNCKGRSKGAIAASSGRGPTLDGRLKPELCAPGTDIISANSNPDDGACCDCCYDFYTAKTGTSMAAPHVAGAIALLFSKNKDLEHSDLRQMLTNPANLIVDSFTGNTANNDYGHGKLDIKKLIDATPAAGGRTAQAPPEETPVAAPRPAPVRPALPADSPLARFMETEQGKTLYLTGKIYYEAARQLIYSNKRVATVWHRNSGPLMGHHVIRFAMMPNAVFPSEINGATIRQRVDNIAAVFRRYGSAELVEALEIVYPLALQLPGKNMHEVIELFQAQNVETHA